MELPIKEEPLFGDEHPELSTQCCFLCHEGQDMFTELTKHFRVSHSEDYHQLPDDSIVQLCSCPDAIQLQFRLLNHMLSKALPPKTENFSTLDDLELPVKVEMEDENSDSSEKKSQRRKRRRRVELTESEGFTVKCDFCPRLFTKTQSLHNHHNLMHNPVNQFKCTRCEHGHCKTLRNLNSHLKTHDEEEEVRRTRDGDDDLQAKVCLRCGKEWQTEQQLYHHMLTHREKLLECDHCGARFNMKNSLWRHMLTHSKQKQKQQHKKKELCQHCPALVSSFNLKRHIRTQHSADRFVYKCDFAGCARAFSEAQNLRDHRNYHLGVRPHVCEFCGKSFERVKSLRRHRVRHTDPQRYRCDICRACFVTRTSLNSHVQRQHRDCGNDAKPFACDFEGCASAFKYSNYLQHHVRDVHVRKRVRNRRQKEKEDIR